MSSAAGLLATLQARGVRFERLDGGRLGLEYPQGAVNDDELAELRRHKAEIVALLSPLPELPPELTRPLAPIMRSRRELAEVVNVHGAANLWSSAMVAEVLVVRDDLVETFQRDDLGRVVFSLSEVLALPAGMPPEGKRAVYLAKRALRGDVVAARAPDGRATAGAATVEDLTVLELEVWPKLDAG